MRFPIDPLPPVGVVDNPYEIRGASRIRPVHAVDPRTQQEVLRPHFEPVAPVEERPAGTEARAGADRRQGDRRNYTQKVLVDTRLGRDRRHSRRRPDDPPPPSVDETV